MDIWDRVRASRDADDGRPVYERIAETIAAAIQAAEFAPGTRLPTVRDLSQRLNVSSTTIMSVYARLREDRLVRGETGRGTFVRTPEQPVASATVPAVRPRIAAAHRHAWRRRQLAQSEARLRAAHPGAVDLMRGSPDPDLFPLEAIKRAFRGAAATITAHSLEYPSQLDVEPELATAGIAALARDGIPADESQLLVMNSSQQFLHLLTLVLVHDDDDNAPVVAVEEPGYQTAMDTFERAGCVLVGVAVDEHGADPDALASALSHGASAVLMTPRAHSPTGVSWSADRRARLADVIADHPDVIVIEDDHFAEAALTPVGSLRSDARIRDRVVYVRSFAKSLAPDLRLAIGTASSGLRAQLQAQKSFADGWTSKVSQRALGTLLGDDEVASNMARARTDYAERRAAVLATLDEHLSGMDVRVPDAAAIDGLHVWLELPVGCSADQVVEHAAAQGFLVAPGEPFFVRPGNDRFIRLNAGAADVDVVTTASKVVAQAIERASSTPAVALMTP